jgi:hypothetical protein
MPTTREIVHSALGENFYEESEARHEESARLVRRLERAHGQNAAGHRLAAKLRSCRLNHRCGSPACPQCAGAEQMLLASATATFIGSFADELDVAFVTIIPPNSRVAVGELHLFDTQNFKRRLRDRIVNTSAICAVGAIDLTLNEHRDTQFEAHWAPHAHMIAVVYDLAQFEEQLRAVFPRSVEAPRPI